jgi:acyl-coenzyme A synthetase/AMP-(fatty) acid ligase/peptidoglycan/LPS O-acetylase OafA/YrhL
MSVTEVSPRSMDDEASPLGGEVLGVVATSSILFVRTVFEAHDAGTACVFLRRADDHERLRLVCSLAEPEAGGGWAQLHYKPVRDERICQIAYSSGTTGEAKAIALTRGNVADAALRLVRAMAIDESIREYVGVPVHYSFGLGRCRAVSAVGGAFYIPPRGFDVAEIGALLAAGEINAISAVPTLWRLVLQSPGALRQHGPKVRWIEIGSQPMSRAEKEAMKALFPNAVIVQHYGLTEASRSTFLKIHQENGQALESVGRAEDGVEVRVDPAGMIQVRGPHVAPWRVIDGRLEPLTDQEGWLATGDIGALQGGRLVFEGRADDMINCAGVKLSPERLERALLADLGVEAGLTVCRVPDALRGEGVLVAYERGRGLDEATILAAAARTVEAAGAPASGTVRLLALDCLPTTETGKIRRGVLGALYGDGPAAPAAPARRESGLAATLAGLWADARGLSEEERNDSFFELGDLPTDPDDQSAADDAVGPIRAVFEETFAGKAISAQDSFTTLGGDSLSYVTLSLQLEENIGFLPPQWEEKSLAELEALIPTTKAAKRSLFQLRPIDSEVVIRACAIVAVVITHARSNLPLGGGADVLLLLAGYNLSRYQRTKLFEGKVFQVLLSFAKRIILPYYLIMLAYLAFKQRLDLHSLLLISNMHGRTGPLQPYWFLELLLQCMGVIALLFCLAPVRRAAMQTPWRFGLMLLAGGLAAKVTAFALFRHHYLLNRTPDALFFLLALGWCVHQAASTGRKLLLTTILAAIAVLSITGLPGLWDVLSYPANISHSLWLLVAVGAILWTPKVQLPGPVRSAFVALAAASFYIYLMHVAPLYLIVWVWNVQNTGLAVSAALATGLLTWWIARGDAFGRVGAWVRGWASAGSR